MITSGGVWEEGVGENVVLHDLALNVGLKVSPFVSKIAPFAALGFRCDYVLAYDDIIIVEPGTGLRFGMYKNYIEAFNKLNVGGLLGIGIEFNDLYYIEIEFNPSMTKSYRSIGMDITDRCIQARVGFNIIN